MAAVGRGECRAPRGRCARDPRRAGPPERSADARVRESRRPPGHAHGLRTPRPAPQRPLRQLGPEPRAAARRAPREHEGRRRPRRGAAASTTGRADRRGARRSSPRSRTTRRRCGSGSASREAEKVGATYQESLQYPSLNVRGLCVRRASARRSRTSSRARPSPSSTCGRRRRPTAQYLVGLLGKHVEKQGYHLVDGEPTDDERARYREARPARGRPRGEGRAPAATTRPSAGGPSRRSSGRSQSTAAKREPVRIRMMGGTVPTHAIVAPLGVPFVLVPTRQRRQQPARVRREPAGWGASSAGCGRRSGSS